MNSIEEVIAFLNDMNAQLDAAAKNVASATEEIAHTKTSNTLMAQQISDLNSRVVALTAQVAMLSKENAYLKMTPNQRTVEDILEYASTFIGVPYLFGAKVGDTAHFDCSSFTKTAYGKFAIALPRTSSDQSKTGVLIPAVENAIRGDLFFFDLSARPTPTGVDHVAIYLGDNMLLQANTSKGVNIGPFSSFYQGKLVAIRRVVN